MTRHVARAYAAAVTLLVLFVAWAAIAAHPWPAGGADPRLAAQQAREAHLRHEAARVRRLVHHRWAVYRVRLSHRHAEIAAAERAHRHATAAAAATAIASSGGGYSAPSVRVVTLPPVTVTRTS